MPTDLTNTWDSYSNAYYDYVLVMSLVWSNGQSENLVYIFKKKIASGCLQYWTIIQNTWEHA